jgi:7-cyano-7-deazaguanine synthase
MTKKRAVCLISGGLDSCVAAFCAKEQGYEVYGLSFRYGQRHAKELVCAKKIGKANGVKDHIFFPVNLSKFGGSSLLASSSRNVQHHKIQDIGKTIPSTYVPGRNTVFLSLALAYAETIDADAIFIGINTVDYSGYPDCRPEYLQAFKQLASLATRKGIERKTIRIEAPLLHLSKAEIIRRGAELNVPFADTWSCYQGGRKACGKCDSCILRLKGFQEASMKDPLSYEEVPVWYTQVHKNKR